MLRGYIVSRPLLACRAQSGVGLFRKEMGSLGLSTSSTVATPPPTSFPFLILSSLICIVGVCSDTRATVSFPLVSCTCGHSRYVSARPWGKYFLLIYFATTYLAPILYIWVAQCPFSPCPFLYLDGRTTSPRFSPFPTELPVQSRYHSVPGWTAAISPGGQEFRSCCSPDSHDGGGI